MMQTMSALLYSLHLHQRVSKSRYSVHRKTSYDNTRAGYKETHRSSLSSLQQNVPGNNDLSFIKDIKPYTDSIHAKLFT